MRLLFIVIFLTLSQASVIKVLESHTTRFSFTTPPYRINSKLQYINTDAFKKHYFFFNRKKMAELYYYQKDGNFSYKNFSLNFKKSFESDGKLFFKKVNFKNKKMTIKAKECFTKTKTLKYLKCKNTRYYLHNKIVKTKIHHTFILR